MYDLVIIGSGPAGLSAAVYAKRAGFHTLVLEKGAMSGGQVLTTYEVDNYLGMKGMNGFDLGMKFREHADHMGVEFLEAEAVSIEEGTESGVGEAAELVACEKTDPCIKPGRRAEAGGDKKGGRIYRIVTNKGDYETRAVLAATGAVHARLHVPGEEELAGMGVSYCATCDGAFFRNKTVAVVGGGDVALEDAIFLARICEKVYLIHRRDALRGAKSLQENVFKQDNIEILWDTVVEEIAGEGRVERLRIKNKKTLKESELPVQGVFIAVGIVPNSQSFQGLVEMEKGYIKAGEDTRTSAAGIFAAGDVRTKQLRQIVTAAADGANAVTSAERYLLGQ